MIRAKRRTPPTLLAECRKLITYSTWLLRAAGLHAGPEEVMEVIRSAPRTTGEGDAGRTGRRSLCIIALLAASDNPMTDQQYQRFRTAAAYWLDVWPLIAPARRQRLQAMIETVLGGFGEE